MLYLIIYLAGARLLKVYTPPAVILGLIEVLLLFLLIIFTVTVPVLTATVVLILPDPLIQVELGHLGIATGLCVKTLAVALENEESTRPQLSVATIL